MSGLSSPSPRAESTTTRRAALAVAVLALLGLGLRLFSVYPPTLRHDPATIALQACRILDGERPIFWSGQAWMGAAGTYVEALLFALFGKNTLVMSLYAWSLAALWVLLSLLLAWRFFGPRAAVWAAALWLVPTPALFYWSSQARNDYQVFFVATPLILLLAHETVRAFRAGRSLLWRAALLGFVCGFSFWQNMAIGPCLVVTFAVLALHLGRSFWTRFVWLYAPAWLIGFAPVLHYNLTTDFAARTQGGLASPAAIGAAVADLLTNVLPYFWGMPPEDRPGGLWQAAQFGFLGWTLLLFVLCGALALRAWRRREDTLADQLLLGLAVLQILVPTLTQYGKDFGTRGNPILFITNLYTVAFALLAALFTRVPGTARLLLALPLLIYVGNNAGKAAAVPREFFAALREQGAAAIRSFPDPAQPLIALLAGKGLSHGYMESRLNPELNLAGLGIVEFARPYQDRVVDYALRADAASDVFWFSHRGLPDGFRMVGSDFDSLSVGRGHLYSNFRKKAAADVLLEGYAVASSHAPPGAAAVSDRDAGTLWQLPSPLPEAWLHFEFPAEERVDRVTLLLASQETLPARLIVQRSRDGSSWETVDEWPTVGAYFWSVRHPFLKAVKPRCELVLSRPEPARHLRLLIPAQAGTCALREIYLHRADPAAAPAATLDEEIAALARALEPLRETHLIAGDHYFMSFFRLAGFDVEFIPNRTVNNSGRLNPFLAKPLPLDFSRPLALIVPASHGPSVSRRLQRAGVPSERRPFARHDLFLTAAAQTSARLYWSGFDLLDTSAPPVDSRGRPHRE